MGRQGIFTRSGDLWAHEFLYRAGHEHSLRVDRWSAQAQDRATLKVLEATFRSCGTLATAADTLVFINFTRSFVVGELPVPPLPSHLVIEIVESVHADPEVLGGVRRLTSQGFRIAIDDFVGLADQRALLPYADYVKVDMRDLAAQGPALLDLAGSHGATLVAERIETLEDRDWCRALGFQLFQGNALDPAQVIERAAVPASRWPAVGAAIPTQPSIPLVEVTAWQGAREHLGTPAVARAVAGWL